jgi:hypothetical protein
MKLLWNFSPFEKKLQELLNHTEDYGSAPLTHNVIVKASRLLHLKATKPYVLESAISLTCQEVAEQAHIWKNQKAGYAESLRQFFDNHFNDLYIE